MGYEDPSIYSVAGAGLSLIRFKLVRVLLSLEHPRRNSKASSNKRLRFMKQIEHTLSFFENILHLGPIYLDDKLPKH